MFAHNKTKIHTIQMSNQIISNKTKELKKSIVENKGSMAVVAVSAFAINTLLNATGGFMTAAIGGFLFATPSIVKSMVSYCKDRKKTFDTIIEDRVQLKFDKCVKEYNLKDWDKRRKFTFVGKHCADDIDAFFNSMSASGKESLRREEKQRAEELEEKMRPW